MITAIIFLLISLLALFYGAGWLVRGSSSLATKMGVSPVIIGLTIVAFGTSAPELVVSLNASINGQGDIAMGNIVGSNIYNICIILGISALKSPLVTKNKFDKLDIPVMILSTLVLSYSLWHGNLSRATGLSFLTALVIYIFLRVNLSLTKERKSEYIKIPTAKRPFIFWLSDFLFIGSGILVLIFASNLLVDNAVIIAQGLGVNNAAIAITVIAAGTSLPELATSFVAATQKDPELAIGNIVGSNIFNILGIAGLAASVSPIHAPGIEHLDLLVMAGVSTLMLPLVFTKLKIGRIEGGILLIIYVAYAIALLLGIF